MPITHLVHALLLAALLIPLAALGLAVVALSFGVAWRQKGRR